MPSKSSRRCPSDIGRKKSLKVICENPANLGFVRSAVGLLKDHAAQLKITVQTDAFSDYGTDEIAEALVSLRLTDATKREERAIDSFALREFEKRALTGSSRSRGVPCEGVGLMKLYLKLLPSSCAEEACIVITDRLIMTWSDDDLRYHARVVVFGFPNVISMSGLVEAPARPREYYLAKQALDYSGIGVADRALSEQFSGRFIEADDERTGQVLAGYMLQCFFYHNTLKPFCRSKDCALYNAHWQEEVIRAHVKSGKLCDGHQRMLEEMVSGGKDRQSV